MKKHGDDNPGNPPRKLAFILWGVLSITIMITIVIFEDHIIRAISAPRDNPDKPPRDCALEKVGQQLSVDACGNTCLCGAGGYFEGCTEMVCESDHNDG